MIERISFLTPDNQKILFGNLYNILYFVMPLILIWIAFEYGGTLIDVIRNAFSKMDHHDDKYDDYDED